MRNADGPSIVAGTDGSARSERAQDTITRILRSVFGPELPADVTAKVVEDPRLPLLSDDIGHQAIGPAALPQFAQHG